MKTRLGFVSNSSSSSFCVMGCSVSEERAEEIDEILKDTRLELNGGEDWEGGAVIGMSVNEMKEDETKAEFRDRVQKELDRLEIKVDEELDWIHDGGYFG